MPDGTQVRELDCAEPGTTVGSGGAVAAKAVEKTAFGAGMMRALEGHVRQPLFDDPLAERLLTGWPAVVVANKALRWAFVRLMDRTVPGFYGAVVCRTRVIDDACRCALADGLAQVVILGAGMDTRPYRMPEMRAVRVWELDLPAVQEAKKAALARVPTRPPAHMGYAPVDLTQQRVGDVLAGAGIDQDARTLLICEAVSLYLPDGAVEEVLAYAACLPPGSRFVLTYLPRSVSENPRYARWVRRLHWQTAFHPPELARRLAGHGLSVLADLGAEDHQARPLRPLGRTLDVFDGERVVVAEKAGATGRRSGAAS
jgi:methyltransferase (TIGR00027 family)